MNYILNFVKRAEEFILRVYDDVARLYVESVRETGELMITNNLKKQKNLEDLTKEKNLGIIK